MKTIHKYGMEISIRYEQEIQIPVNAKVLSVQIQDHGGVGGRQLCMWALVDTELDYVVRRFRVFGTGHKVDTKHAYKHLATVQDGGFVWHVFEVIG